MKLRIHLVAVAFALRAWTDGHVHQPQLIGAPRARRLDRMQNGRFLHVTTSCSRKTSVPILAQKPAAVNANAQVPLPRICDFITESTLFSLYNTGKKELSHEKKKSSNQQETMCCLRLLHESMPAKCDYHSKRHPCRREQAVMRRMRKMRG